MRVLITGGTGFVGSWAAVALSDAGHDVRLLVRDPAKAERVYAAHGRDAPELVVANMTDTPRVRDALQGCDAVLHAAAQVGVADGNVAGIAANADGVRTVIGAALDAGVDSVVYTSSVVALYPPSSAVLGPDSPLSDPGGPYGRSKVEAERWVRAQQACGAPITSLLLGGVVGPRQPVIDSATTGIIAAARQVMVVPPGGVGVLDVRDVAALVVAAFESGGGPRRFLAGGPFLSWPEWTDTLSTVLGRDVRRMATPQWSLTALGRSLDALKRFRSFDYPMTYEAALAMTCAVPTDDRATLVELGLAWRAPAETLRDAVAWLLAEGHLTAKHAPALAGAPR